MTSTNRLTSNTLKREKASEDPARSHNSTRRRRLQDSRRAALRRGIDDGVAVADTDPLPLGRMKVASLMRATARPHSRQ